MGTPDERTPLEALPCSRVTAGGVELHRLTEGLITGEGGGGAERLETELAGKLDEEEE